MTKESARRLGRVSLVAAAVSAVMVPLALARATPAETQ